jgi:hypothetical protein
VLQCAMAGAPSSLFVAMAARQNHITVALRVTASWTPSPVSKEVKQQPEAMALTVRLRQPG